MKNQIAIALLALSTLQKEKNRVSPLVILKPHQREIKGLKNAVERGIGRLGELDQDIATFQTEISEIQENLPKLQIRITEEKELLAHATDMTLKEMLSIQQNVAKLEENLGNWETQILENETAIDQSRENRLAVEARIIELKKQFNEKIKKYQQLKQENELQVAALESKEEVLREELDPKTIGFFDETLKYVTDKPVVRIMHDFCGGCNIAVSSQLVRMVANQDELQRCEHCKRILLPASTSVSETE